MNSETYATDYTTEEQASELWQSSPPEVHVQLYSLKGYHATTGADAVQYLDSTTTRNRDVQEEHDGKVVSVRYLRSDLFDAKAAELETALKHAHGLHTDLAKLDEQRAPQFAYLIVKRGAHGGVPVGFQLSEDAAWTMAELYSADEGGREFDVRKLPLATAALVVRP